MTDHHSMGVGVGRAALLGALIGVVVMTAAAMGIVCAAGVGSVDAFGVGAMVGLWSGAGFGSLFGAIIVITRNESTREVAS